MIEIKLILKYFNHLLSYYLKKNMETIKKCQLGCNRYVDITKNMICCNNCHISKHAIDCILNHDELKNRWIQSQISSNNIINEKLFNWASLLDFSKSQNKAEIFLLPKHKSLLILKHIINASKMKSVVGFDYDQTISLTTKVKYGSETKSVNELRGGTESNELFEYLNHNNIPWFIISARGVSSVEYIYHDLLKYDINPMKKYNITSTLHLVSTDGQTILNQPEQSLLQTTVSKSYPLMFNYTISSVKDTQRIYCGIYNNCVSCSSEGNSEYSCSYEKDYALELSLKLYDIEPELIIFVDDNARNIYTLYNYYLTSKRNIHFIGIVYEPFIPEKEHDSYLTYIKDMIWTKQIISDLMFPFVGSNEPTIII